MKTTAIIIRNVPESVHQAIKIAAIREGKTMQALILELITKHIEETPRSELEETV